MKENGASLIAMNVLTAPNAAFPALKERPTLLVPLCLLLLAAFLTTFIYMNGVDIEWLFTSQAQGNPEITAEQAERVEQFAEFIGSIPQATLAVLFACAAVASVGIVLLLQSLYFKIVTWITRDGISYKHWFSMVAWCSLPSLLSSLASIVKLLSSDLSLMPRGAINPLSFGNLLAIEPAGALGRLLANLDPMTLWTVALLILCYGIFTRRSLAASAGIVLLPTIALIALALVF
jgi:hypothetical protein